MRNQYYQINKLILESSTVSNFCRLKRVADHFIVNNNRAYTRTIVTTLKAIPENILNSKIWVIHFFFFLN